eukprot:Hpha_TRINITY_DN14310_c0_g2::TRINITY_DN14310_c0_g2_i1::g.86818::m.86818/K00799/GST, gst; glutathione S-transferase
MAPLKLWGNPFSQPARAVAWACDHEGLKYEYVMMIPGKDTKKPEYVNAGRLSTVPRIEDDGFVLNESHAILVYLANKHGWSLYPKDLKVRARVDEYLHYHHRSVREITLGLFAPAMRPDLKIPPVLTVVNKMNAKNGLIYLEKILSNSPWIAGDSATLADIVAYTEVGQCLPHHFDLADLSKWPHVVEWTKRCEQLPGYASSHKPLAKLAPKFRAQIAKVNGGRGKL